MPYSEFFCNPISGVNLYAGSTEVAPVFSFASGSWDGTSIFTAPAADLSSVASGLFASVYLNNSSLTNYVSRVVGTPTSSNIQLSTTVKSGTSPASGLSNASIVVGGPWKGPDGGVGFPFNFITTSLTNGSGDPPRVNFKNNSQYNIISGITNAVVGPLTFQGYTNVPDDGGRATVDGGTVGSSFVLLTNSATQVILRDFILENNGATGTAGGVTFTVGRCSLERITVNSVRGAGFLGFAGSTLYECEAYGCNQSNTVNFGGFNTGANSSFIRCVSHNNSTSNSNGFSITGNLCFLDGCISDSNGLHGFAAVTASIGEVIKNCVAYNNGGAGFSVAVANTTHFIENSLFISNTTYGVNNTVASSQFTLYNNGFFGNISGETNGLSQAAYIVNSMTLAAQPLTDPANGDFSPAQSTVKNTGRGNFVQDIGSYTSSSTSFPNIGAIQHICASIVMIVTGAIAGGIGALSGLSGLSGFGGRS